MAAERPLASESTRSRTDVLTRDASAPEEATPDRGVPAMERANDLDRSAILDDLCSRLDVGVVVSDANDRVVWANGCARRDFCDGFAPGSPFHAALAELTLEAPEAHRVPPGDLGPPPTRRRLLRSLPDGRLVCFRHVTFPLRDADGAHVHCLVEITSERELEQSLRNNRGQLASIREIIDTLYESLGSREVLHLILIAVTSGRGFGFNRAFYLQAAGGKLRGKLGIGPSSQEDAHRIWRRIDDLNLSTLRDLYQNMTRDGETPDPLTNQIAKRMELRLDHDDGSRLVAAVRSREPAVLDAKICTSDVDARLFGILDSDSIAVVPLWVRDELAGVLIADNFVTRKEITDADLTVLKTLSRYAGIALERSSLHDELSASVLKLREANSSLKRHQKRLIQAEKLSALGKLAAQVSHEIRNPLVMIGGHARSLLAGMSGNVGASADDRESLRIIVNEVDRLEKYLSDTLDFAKPERDRAECYDLRLCVVDCFAPLRRELDERSIEVRLELGDEPLWCRVDPESFRRALGNLIKNSAEAISEDGAITVRASSTEHVARLELRDSGPGIPRELHSRIFEPFFTTKPEGTGLGMAIAAENIRSLGGDISLQAEEGLTSIFVIELPACEAPAPDSPNPEPTRRESIAS